MIVCGIDLGTQSLKAVVYDSGSHGFLAESSCPLALRQGEGGLREQEASWYIDALEAAFSKIDSRLRKQIEVISVSGQQHGFVPLAGDGTVLYSVKLWCDTSTVEECREIEEACGGRADLARRIGNPIPPGYTAGKIRWLYRHHRELYEHLDSVLLPHDYLNYYLTGEIVMERGDASGTGLMDIFSSSWDEEVVAACAPGLMAKLPPINGEGIIGQVRESACASLGLSSHCLVASGGGDNMMSAIGSGSVASGSATMSLGTSGTLFATTESPAWDAKGRFASFASSTGGYLPLLCTMNCTVASETVRKLFDIDLANFDSTLGKAKPGSGGLVMLPFLNGERVPDYPHGEGVITGIRQNNLTKENILLSSLEGVTYSLLLGLDAFRESGIEIKEITLTGGGANSACWRQLVSDMTGLEVRVPAVGEAAAFGAALQGLWCATGGSIEAITKEHIAFDEKLSCTPNMELHSFYSEGYEKWLSLCNFFAPRFS